MKQTADKPLSFASQSATSTPVRVQYHSCFVAGTGVWTPNGQTPNEQLRAGDLVLSQDVRTGELAYKPVTATTVRSPSPLVELDVGGATIRATRGHPFWVSGIGWKMAKELVPGEWLHTAAGAAPIDDIRSAPAEKCYNLVVAHNDNYFVSDARLLVHDNNMRDVRRAIVPGLEVDDYTPDVAGGVN
jgi:hypothetical protein